MKKYVMLALAAAAVIAAPAYTAFQAHAEDAAVEATADAAVAAEVKELTLKDGTKVHVKGEEVFVVGADGAETPAPDGTHELEDGSTVVTVGGKIAPATEETPAAE